LPSFPPTIADHFKGRAPSVRTIYDEILSAAAALGPVKQEPKKTCIHLVRRTAFAGVATRKDVLILTLKSTADVRSRRIAKREQASANRWHLYIRLNNPSQVDAELKAWLKKSIAIAS